VTDAPESRTDAQAEAEAVLVRLATGTALLPQELPDDVEAPPEGALALPVVEQDGVHYVPVFTSADTLANAGVDPASVVEVSLAQLAGGWPEQDLWMAVDPASPDGVTLPPDVVRLLPHLAEAASGSGSSSSSSSSSSS